MNQIEQVSHHEGSATEATPPKIVLLSCVPGQVYADTIVIFTSIFPASAGSKHELDACLPAIR